MLKKRFSNTDKNNLVGSRVDDVGTVCQSAGSSTIKLL